MTSDSKDNDDVKRHLLNIEARLDRLSVSPQLSLDSLSARRDDEIDLREIWDILWCGKWWIVGVAFSISLITVFYALTLPNQYKAEVVLAPAQENNGGIGGLAAQYSGLAAMAGISLRGGQGSDVDQAIALLRSWPFLDTLVEKYNLKPLIMAVKGWDSVSNKVIYDLDIYDPSLQQWMREPKPGRPQEPTSYEVYKVFSGMIMVNQDAKTGLIRVSVEHYVPKLAYDWSNLIVKEINQYFQYMDVLEATQNIEYLHAKIKETSLAEMQSVFYRMIEAQMKTLMLAEVSGEYLLKSAVPSVLPEEKSRPRRSLICIAGAVFGGLIGVFVVFALHLRRQILAGRE